MTDGTDGTDGIWEQEVRDSHVKMDRHTKRLYEVISQTLERIPLLDAELLVENVRAFVNCDCALAFMFSSDTQSGRYFVVFKQTLLEMPPAQRDVLILHEMAHCYLGHETLPRGNATVTHAEYVEHELQVWNQVAEWLGRDAQWVSAMLEKHTRAEEEHE